MEKLDLENITKLDKLNSELEYEKSISIYGRLRWLEKEDSSLKPIKQHLKALIKKYEDCNWNDEDQINEKRIEENDIAEKIVFSENEFLQKRKRLLKTKLKENGLSQIDLADILGHRPNYMSELINGVRPFSRDDIIVLHRLFDIDLKDLVPPFLKTEVANHIKQTLIKLNRKKAKMKLKLTDI